MSQKRIAVYPGSFDPITLGHVNIIERVCRQFDEVVVLVAHSSQKAGLFSTAERVEMIRNNLKGISNLKVEVYDGLTVDFVKRINAQVIVRGLRAVVDFEYEMTMASMNKKLAPDIETMLVFASPEHYYISSRGVKEVAKHGGSLKGLVSDEVAHQLKLKLQSNREAK